MIDVCLWRNQGGAQINFSLSSFDFIGLICFLAPPLRLPLDEWSKGIMAFVPVNLETPQEMSPPVFQSLLPVSGHGPNVTRPMSALKGGGKARSPFTHLPL